MHSAADDEARAPPGCPIRIRVALRSLAAPHPRFAALRVLLRHLAPQASPQHPSPLGIFAKSRRLPIVPHAHPNARVRYVRSDERSTYDLGTRSLRQNRSKSHCHDCNRAHETLDALRPRSLSRQGLHSRSAVVQVLQPRPRPCRETVAPAEAASLTQHHISRTPAYVTMASQPRQPSRATNFSGAGKSCAAQHYAYSTSVLP